MSESVLGLVRALNDDLARLLSRLRGWTGVSWRVTVPGGSTRAERTAALSGQLARLGREAGSGAPADAVPPPLAAHGLADQVSLLADDLLRQLASPELEPSRRAAVCAEAAAVVAAARADLDGVGFGFAAGAAH